jgi:hypothetical protein
VVGETGFRGHRLLVALDLGGGADVVLVATVFRIEIGAQRQRQSLLDAQLQVGVVRLEPVAGGRWIAAHHAQSLTM